ncbi:MAG: hypothetical protein AB8B47_00315 [Roseobacter sp.]
MKRLSAAFVILATVLTACGPDADDILFDGEFFRTKIKTERGSRQNFVVTARPVQASLEGAREAARYEATVYCVNRYGRSDIIWAVGPDSPDEELPISGDTLTFEGQCRE